jgi:hypothetical protein
VFGTAPTVLHVSGVATLSTLFSAPASGARTMELHFSSGVRVFVFTFG